MCSCRCAAAGCRRSCRRKVISCIIFCLGVSLCASCQTPDWSFGFRVPEDLEIPIYSCKEPLLLSEKVRYASSRVLAYCGSFHHVTNVISKKNEARDQLVSPTKINKKRERETTSPKPWASPAVAASVAHAPPARVMAR